jgi:hypothetical protein
MTIAPTAIVPYKPDRLHRNCRRAPSCSSDFMQRIVGHVPITVAARSKGSTVFACSNCGHEFESHSRHGILCAFILCVGSGLARGWAPFQGVLPTMFRLRNWKIGQRPQGLYSHRHYYRPRNETKPLNSHCSGTIRAPSDLTMPAMAGERTSIRQLGSSISDLSLVAKVGHTYCSAMQSS